MKVLTLRLPEEVEKKIRIKAKTDRRTFSERTLMALPVTIKHENCLSE